MVDEGKVKLTDPVEKYLPEFRGLMFVAERDADHVLLRRPRQPITVRQVLCHTSGLPFATPMEQPTLDRLSLADRVRSYAMGPLEFAPDSQYRYSNAGINTAGRIVEVVSGMSFEAFLDKRLFGPLGMKDTTFWPSAAQAGRIAKSYRPGKGGRGLVETTITQLSYPLTDRAKRASMPAGGLFSTARDVARFYQMLLNGGQWDGRQVLSASSVKEMTRRQTPANLKASYGLGLSVGRDWFGHGGAYSTNTSADTGRGLVFVWLVQHAGFPGQGGKSQGAFKAAALEAFAPADRN
jgi:CubicO group peptidase (beta-lactamase class C family)